MYESGVSTRTANELCRELRAISDSVDFSDYVVDLCFLTYVADGLGADYAAGTGIRPGLVGRKQHRFIINLEVPPGLTDRETCGAWIGNALAVAAQITRDYLPRKGKTYPAGRLADEVDDLRTRWITHMNTTA
jgi:hypothetical protein